MNKEQTPITAEELMNVHLSNRGFSKDYLLNNRGLIGAVIEEMEQRVNTKVLEALEREKDLKNMLFRAYCKPFTDDENKIEQDMLIVLLARFEKYYETEVKPKYYVK